MPRPRIVDLLAAIPAIGICLAALRSASATWTGASCMLVIGALLWAVLGASFRRGEARALYSGFVLFGATYYLVCFAPWFAHEVGPWLPTSRLLDELYEYGRPVPAQSAPGRIESWDFYNRNYIKLNPYSTWIEGRDHFRKSGHSVTSLVMGILGGLLARGHWRHSAEPAGNAS